MQCDGMLCLHNLIFISRYVIERHSVASLMTSLKFKVKFTYVQKETYF